MRVVRRCAVAGVMGCAVAAVFGVLTARSRATVRAADPLAALVREVPPYPGAPFFALGDRLQADGIGRTLAHAQTLDGPVRVIDHYEGVLRAQGFEVQRSDSDGEAWVVATLPRDPLIRTVVATATPSTLGTRTAIIASLSEKRTAERTAIVPVPPPCQVVTSHAAVDAGVHTELAFLSCRQRLEDVRRFYSASLTEATRHVLMEPTVDRKDLKLRFTDPRRVVTLMAREAAGPPLNTVVSVVWQEERR